MTLPATRRYINVGAHDGHSDDPLYEYARLSNATGIAVERDPERCKRHEAALPKVPVACSEASHEAMTSRHSAGLMAILAAKAGPLESGKELDVLKVDIDSYDCPVLEMILPEVQAKIVLVEANPSIPPPYQWAMLHSAQLWAFFNSFHSPEEVPIRGCSLAYEVQLLRRYGYDLVAFGGHDAVFTHQSVRSAFQPYDVPMDEFDCYNEVSPTEEPLQPLGAGDPLAGVDPEAVQNPATPKLPFFEVDVNLGSTGCTEIQVLETKRR
eukprot:Skav212072  [mRNA]  locus=scaffold867:54998:63119:+ [translate_table: standard]